MYRLCIMASMLRIYINTHLPWILSIMEDIEKNIVAFYTSLTTIQGPVRRKCLRFFKCLEFPKSRFSIFLNFSGRQKWTALTASDRWSMMEMSLMVVDVVLVDEKDKAYINHSGKFGYVTVCYLVSTY